MDQQYISRFQQHISSYVTLSEKEFERLISFFTIKKVKKKEWVLQPGQVCRFEHFVVKGLFQTVLIDRLGKEHTKDFPHENWWVGDFKSFKNQSPSGLSIQALENSILLSISKNAFDQLIMVSEPFANYIRALSENNGIAMQERVLEQLAEDTAAKYHNFIRKYPTLAHRLTQRKLASYLGVSPEHLNKVVHR